MVSFLVVLLMFYFGPYFESNSFFGTVLTIKSSCHLEKKKKDNLCLMKVYSENVCFFSFYS